MQEALDSAGAVGDFDTSKPGHHGTPEQREPAWNTGFESGDPSSVPDQFLEPSNVGDDGGAAQQDPGYGVAQAVRPAGSRN